MCECGCKVLEKFAKKDVEIFEISKLKGIFN